MGLLNFGQKEDRIDDVSKGNAGLRRRTIVGRKSVNRSRRDEIAA